MECERFRDDGLDVLYGDADAATIRRVDEHHAVCASCRDEMAALRRVRRDLAAWELPPRGAAPAAGGHSRWPGWPPRPRWWWRSARASSSPAPSAATRAP
jgi:hypothetical protein